MELLDGPEMIYFGASPRLLATTHRLRGPRQTHSPDSNPTWDGAQAHTPETGFPLARNPLTAWQCSVSSFLLQLLLEETQIPSPLLLSPNAPF